MSFISYIKNSIVSIFLIGIWIILIFFGAISYVKPTWLVNISSQGRLSEASDLKNEGDIFLKEKKHVKAISIYIEALKRQPNYTGALINMGIAYSKIKHYDKALKTYISLIDKDIKRKNVIYYNMAEIYKETNKTGRAVKYYIKSAETAPFPIHSYQKAGELLMNSKRFDQSIFAFNKGLENILTIENSYIGMLKRDINNFDVDSESYEIISVLLNQKSFNLSKYDNTIYKETISKDINIAKSYNNIGYCLAMKGEINEAISYFNKSLKIRPNFKDAKQNLRAVKNM